MLVGVIDTPHLVLDGRVLHRSSPAREKKSRTSKKERGLRLGLGCVWGRHG